MTAPLLTPFVDSLVVAYLNTAVSGAGARTKVPETLPTKFTHIILTGGAGRRNLVLHDANVTVEAWAKTYDAAATLMQSLDAAMHNARNASTTILNVTSYGAPVELPIPGTTYTRLTATYEVTVRVSAS